MGKSKGWEALPMPTAAGIREKFKCLDCGWMINEDSRILRDAHDEVCIPGLDKRPGTPNGMAKLFYSIELRDLFAAFAVVGTHIGNQNTPLTYGNIAEMAYKQADELLAEREKTMPSKPTPQEIMAERTGINERLGGKRSGRE